MLADYHVHTAYCRHAKGSINEYIEKAIALGLNEIGFTDHLGRYYLTPSQKRKHWDWGIKDGDLPRYFDDLCTLKENYKKDIRISIGLEVDYVKGTEQTAAEIMSAYPLDYAICSVHCLPYFGWKHIFQYSDQDPLTLFTEYFSTVKDALNCGVFQVIAHMDLIWRYVPWDWENDTQMSELIRNTVQVAAKSPTIVEINANGYHWFTENNPDDNNPFAIMTEEIGKRNVLITLASDAHEPSSVGNHFTPMIKFLKKQGVHSFCTFDKKKLLKHDLNVK